MTAALFVSLTQHSTVGTVMPRIYTGVPGEGNAWYALGNRYVGQWLYGKPHGEGICYYATGARYEGQFDGGKCHGGGTYFYANGNSYEGDFDNGRMHGVGVYRWPHGDVYRGSWQNDRRSGRGRYECTKVGLTFEGLFYDDRRTCPGSIIFPDGSRYECQWEDDEALDSTAQGSRSVHYRADGTECTNQGHELRNLMRHINHLRLMHPDTPVVIPEAEQRDPQLPAAAIAPSIASTAEAVPDV